jgi:hypothetical protein
MYPIYPAWVLDATTLLPNAALVGQQVQVVTRNTTTPYPIYDAASDPIPSSLMTVTPAGTTPTVYIDTVTPGSVYLDWYDAASGQRGPIWFEEVSRQASLAAQAAAEAALAEAAAANESVQATVAALTQNLVVRVTHRDDADFPRPVWLGPVDWVGTVIPSNMESTDFFYQADPETGGGFAGAMDAFALPWRAYSLRRLLSLYSGPLVRVRRSSDDTTADIGYNLNGSLDTTSLLAFVGVGNGFVTRWYDQSGGGSHLEQGTLAAQPSIVTAGTVNTLDGLPTVTFDGTADWLTVASAGLYVAGAATMALVFAAAPAAASIAVSESNNSGGGANYRLLRSSTAAWNVQATNNTGSMWANSSSGDTSFDSTQHQMFFTDSGALINTWRDGAPRHVNFAATRSGTTTLTNLSVGAGVNGGVAGGFLNGSVQELVLWNSNQGVDRAAISTAQKDFWGTP